MRLRHQAQRQNLPELTGFPLHMIRQAKYLVLFYWAEVEPQDSGSYSGMILFLFRRK